MSSVESHIEPVEYSPDRSPDWQYHELLDAIMLDGEWSDTQMDERAGRITGWQWKFDFEKGGWPVITERDLTKAASPANLKNYAPDLTHRPVTGPLKQGLAETIGFLNGARTLPELEAYGCKWWVNFTSPKKAARRGLEPDDLGPGSYGAAWHDFPTVEGGSFNQIKHVIEQMREMPHLRTHIVTPFVPQYLVRGEGKQQKVIIVPCHGMLHFIINNETRELTLVDWQRSNDVPVGVAFNIANYGALAMMVAQVTETKPVRLVHQMSDVHIYENQREAVEEILARPPHRFPILKLDPSVKELEDFRTEHFSIEDYDSHPPMRVPTPTGVSLDDME